MAASAASRPTVATAPRPPMLSVTESDCRPAAFLAEKAPYHRTPGQAWGGGMLAACVRFTWLDDAGLVGQDDGLDPVAQVELGEQVAHV